LGPYIAVLKTHIDIISDFGQATIDGLTRLSDKHNFLIFEDRKFIDIGNTVQKQYKGGALRIFEWAHIVNASVLAGGGIIQALDEVIATSPRSLERGILILAEMTSQGSLATGEYTRASVQIAQKYPQSVIGFIATRELSGFTSESMGGRASVDDGSDSKGCKEDFIIFTTGVNMSSKGDKLGQQYQTPTSAMEGGSDFLIAGRGIYASPDPVAAVQAYRDAGWNAYLARINNA
jgi:orotidine-5'-phosphate decarboxylase